jgi:maleate cis-trans isomerase
MNTQIVLLQYDLVLENDLKDIPNITFTRINCPTEISVSNLTNLTKSWQVNIDKFDFTIFCCTSASIICDIKPTPKMTTVAHCILDQLEHRRIKEFHLIVPYVKAVSDLVVDFFEKYDLKINSFFSFKEPDDIKVANITIDSLENIVKNLDTACENVVICCTNFNCLNILKTWESKYALNIVTSNQSILNELLHRFKKKIF